MADTLTVNIVDRSVPPMNHVNIAVINQPNPVEGYAATGEQLLILIQMSNYFITETATGTPVTGKNIYEYFPDLDPGGGGGGGGGVTVDTHLSTTSTNPVQNKAIAIAVNSKQDILSYDNQPTQNSTNMVKSGGIYTFVTNGLSNKQDTLSYDAEPTQSSTNIVESGGIYSFVTNALSGKQDALIYDNEPTQDSTNMVKSGGIYSFVTNSLSGKQDTLTYDAEPTENSANMVKSGGIYSYIDSIVGDINTVLEEVL